MIYKILRLLACSIACLIACASPESRKQFESSEARHTFQLVQTGALETLDPVDVIYMADWQIASLCYEGLVGYARNSSGIQPLLASGWEVGKGGLEYIFTLRDKLFFQDSPCFEQGRGKRLSTDDVEFTFERILSRSEDCPNWHLFDGKIRSIKVLDSLRIQFVLTRPYAAFLKILASPTAYIVAKEAVAFYGDFFSHHPVGTGPFRMVSWKPFQAMEWMRHERYWRRDSENRRLPYLLQINIQLGSNPTVAYSEFLKGTNWLFRVDERISKNLFHQVYDPETYNMLTAPLGLTTRFFGFSLDGNSCFAHDSRMRRAIALAFKQSDSTGTKHVSTAFSFVPSYFLKPFKPEWFSHNPDSAARLLEKGCPEPGLTLVSNVESESIFALRESLAGLPLDFNCDIKPTRYFQTILNDRPDLFRVAFLPSFPDPEDYYALFYSKSTADVNLTGYASPAFDALYEAALIEQDADKRIQLFMKMEALLKNDVPALYISHGKPTIYLTPRFVSGLTMRFTLLDFSEVRLDLPDESTL